MAAVSLLSVCVCVPLSKTKRFFNPCALAPLSPPIISFSYLIPVCLFSSFLRWMTNETTSNQSRTMTKSQTMTNHNRAMKGKRLV